MKPPYPTYGVDSPAGTLEERWRQGIQKEVGPVKVMAKAIQIHQCFPARVATRRRDKNARKCQKYARRCTAMKIVEDRSCCLSMALWSCFERTLGPICMQQAAAVRRKANGPEID